MSKEDGKEWKDITVSGIVAAADCQPYVLLIVDGKPAAQFTMAQARQVANDILLMASRTEADAMIHQFFKKEGYPPGAGLAIMVEFRDFRLALDGEEVEHRNTVPADIDNCERAFYPLS